MTTSDSLKDRFSIVCPGLVKMNEDISNLVFAFPRLLPIGVSMRSVEATTILMMAMMGRRSRST